MLRVAPDHRSARSKLQGGSDFEARGGLGGDKNGVPGRVQTLLAQGGRSSNLTGKFSKFS